MPYFPGDANESLKSWQRGLGAPGSQGIATQQASFSIFPVRPGGDYWEGNITASTMALAVSYNFTNTSGNPTAVWSSSYRVGLYTLNGSTLSLLNSASGTWGNTVATSNASTNFNGGRLLTIASSQWSASPELTEGGQYWMAIQFLSVATTTSMSVMQAGVHITTMSGHLNQASSAVSGTQWHPFDPFNGLFNATTNAVPGSMVESQITGLSSNAWPSPWIRFDAGYYP